MKKETMNLKSISVSGRIWMKEKGGKNDIILLESAPQ